MQPTGGGTSVATRGYHPKDNAAMAALRRHSIPYRIALGLF